jgi:biotin carboxyl carrier protein
MEWQITEVAPGELLLERDGKRTRAFVAGTGATRWVFIEGRTWEIEVGALRPFDPSTRSGSPRARSRGDELKVVPSMVEGRQSSGPALRTGSEQVSRSRAGQSGAAGALAAPMPATVIRILVKPGVVVRKGETLILLEAMKMELPLRSPQDGTVRAVRCQEGELVQPGRVLVDLD